MAATLSLIKSPPTIALLDEGLKYEIETSYAAGTGLAQLVITLQTDTPEYPNNNLIIELPVGQLTFVFKTTPDESGLQVTEPAIDQPLSTYAPALAAELNKNYYLNKDYIVTVDASNRIVITARAVGSDYDLSFVSSTVTGIVEYSNTAGVDDDTADDYRVYVAVCEKTGADPMAVEPLGEDWLPIDADATAYADMAEYLKAQLSSSFHWPFASVNVYAVDGAVFPYFIRYAEYKDFTFQVLYHDFATAHYAMAGGLSKLDSDFLLTQSSDLFTSLTKHWLTWAPTTKTTFPTKSEKLYFLLTEASCVLKKKAYYSDTDETTTVQAITQGAYSVIEIFAGVPELFPGEDISDLQRYEVWIETATGTIVDDIRVFEVDHNYYLNTRTILFKNSFDMYDTIHCTGELSVTDNIKRTEMEVLNNNAFRKRILLAENEVQYKLNTGWINKKTRLWLDELLLNKMAYIALGDVLLPIVITTTKAERETDREHNYSLSITFEPDYANTRHSGIIANDGIQYLTDDEGIIFTDDTLDNFFN